MDDNCFAKYVAKITVPKKNGKNAIGTGYAISSCLVITAQHVLTLPQWNQEHPITVEFSGLHDQDEKTQVIAHCQEIVFEGGETVDFAVLRLNRPLQDTIEYSKLSAKAPQPHQQWSSFGYPALGEHLETTLTEKTPVMGEFFPDNDETYCSALYIKGDALKKEDWKGLSGAPVISQGLCYGVIIDTPDNVNERFTAVSIPSLLKKHTAFQNFYKKFFFDEESKKLEHILIDNITSLIDDCESMPHAALKLQLNIATEHASDIAKALIQQPSIEAALRILYNILLKESLNASEIDDQWISTVECFQSIASWLLLKSVRAQWMHQYGLLTNQYQGIGICNQFELQHRHYTEVIVSKWLIQQPTFELDPVHRIQGHSAQSTIMAYDALNRKACSEELLKPIYKDLMRKKEDFKMSEAGLIETIKGQFDAIKPPLTYYLVSQEKLEEIQNMPWFSDLNQALSGYVQFICCQISDTNNKASTENQKILLNLLNAIMVLKFPRD